MKKTAILPLRKGSKGILNKNKKKLLGRSLYQWVLGEAILSNLDEIYIFTDDEEIISFVEKEYTWTKKVKVLKRSKESASDTASTEFCILELAEKINYNFDIICLLQATSPLLESKYINQCLSEIISGAYDSALTVVNSKRFTWNNEGESLNYEYANRPRRQDFSGLLVENGAFYAVRKETFLYKKNRLGGKIKVVNMPEDTLIEIDEPEDWLVVECLLENRLVLNKSVPQKITQIVLDVDGVFTDGSMLFSEHGEFGKTFSLRDGMAMELAREYNINIMVMTSENSAVVKARMEKLNIKNYFLGVKDKYSLLGNYCQENSLEKASIAYIGDDINDLSNLLSVGWAFTPKNAVSLVKSKADIILHHNGGDMAIREMVEYLIKYNKRFLN